MKTVFFSGCLLDGYEITGGSRLDRTIKFYKYYVPLASKLGIDWFYICDSASTPELVPQLMETFKEQPVPVTFFSYPERLTRGKRFDYPYGWRSLYHMKKLFNQFDKIINVESDAFVLSGRLADYIKALDSGWTTFWSPRHSFPDNNIHVLCRDAYSRFEEFCVEPFTHHNGKCMELHSPFTHIEQGFVGDRYGELTPTPEQTPEMDYYFQAPLELPLTFRP
jgi:hypothetical protein